MKTKTVYNNDISKATPDPYLEGAGERVRAAYLDLVASMDKHGNCIQKDLPPDMEEGQDRDFGG